MRTLYDQHLKRIYFLLISVHTFNAFDFLYRCTEQNLSLFCLPSYPSIFLLNSPQSQANAMVLIYEMVTQNKLRTYEGKQDFNDNATALDLIKSLEELKLRISLYKCASISELQSNISIMGENRKSFIIGMYSSEQILFVTVTYNIRVK